MELKASRYFEEVGQEQSRVLAELARRPDQQQFGGDAVLMVSAKIPRMLQDSYPDWKEGVPCLVQIGLRKALKSEWLVARRICDGTHEIARPEQVQQYLADCERKKKEIQAESRKGTLVFAQTPRDPADAVKGA